MSSTTNKSRGSLHHNEPHYKYSSIFVLLFVLLCVRRLHLHAHRLISTADGLLRSRIVVERHTSLLSLPSPPAPKTLPGSRGHKTCHSRRSQDKTQGVFTDAQNTTREIHRLAAAIDASRFTHVCARRKKRERERQRAPVPLLFFRADCVAGISDPKPPPRPAVPAENINSPTVE